MANITAYNAKDCTITVNGVYITGLGKDQVKGTKDEGFFSTSVGAQGDIVKSVTNNSLGTITISIQPTSPQKSMLLGLAGQTNNFPIWVVNKSLNERLGGTSAALKKFPEISRSTESGDMEFEFQVFDYTVEAAE